jgi:hypothetical protein
MKAKSLILYGSKAKLTTAHRRVNNNRQSPYYVRAETVRLSFETALKYARPMDEETVLHTVPID